MVIKGIGSRYKKRLLIFKANGYGLTTCASVLIEDYVIHCNQQLNAYVVRCDTIIYARVYMACCIITRQEKCSKQA